MAQASTSSKRLPKLIGTGKRRPEKGLGHGARDARRSTRRSEEKIGPRAEKNTGRERIGNDRNHNASRNTRNQRSIDAAQRAETDRLNIHA